MPDLKAIEARLAEPDSLEFAENAPYDIADLLAYVRELREALGAVLEPFANGCRHDELTGFCLEHGTLSTLPDGECPVARARRLVNE